MDISEHIRSADLKLALSEAENGVRKDPAAAKHRIALFQILCLMGQWPRARTQLDVIDGMSGPPTSDAATMVKTYKALLAAESVRRAVFEGKAVPIVLGEPAEWVALLLEGLRLGATGQYDKAAEFRAKAFEQAPATPGRLGEQDFLWIADADSRFGPTLEAVVNGRYCWIPFHRLTAIRIEPVKDLRDLVWAPAALTYSTGGETVAFIPTRYPGTDSAADSLRLARMTEWQEKPGETFLGLGQRVLATDTADISILEAREIQLKPSSSS
jgi:type VI secretion system protein ImpE